MTGRRRRDEQAETLSFCMVLYMMRRIGRYKCRLYGGVGWRYVGYASCDRIEFFTDGICRLTSAQLQRTRNVAYLCVVVHPCVESDEFRLDLLVRPDHRIPFFRQFRNRRFMSGISVVQCSTGSVR